MRNKYESNVLELRCMGQLSPPKGHGTLCGAVRPHHKYSVSISVINYRAHWTCRGSALAFFDPTSRLSIRSFTPVWHTDCRHMRHPPKDAASTPHASTGATSAQALVCLSLAWRIAMQPPNA